MAKALRMLSLNMTDKFQLSVKLLGISQLSVLYFIYFLIYFPAISQLSVIPIQTLGDGKTYCHKALGKEGWLTC